MFEQNQENPKRDNLENKEISVVPEKKEILQILKQYIKEIKDDYSAEVNNESELSEFSSGTKMMLLKKRFEDGKILRSFIFGDQNIKKLSASEASDFKIKVEIIRNDIRHIIDQSGGNEEKIANYKILEQVLSDIRKRLGEVGDLDDISSVYADASKEDLESAIKVNEADLEKMEKDFKEISHSNPNFEIEWKQEQREYIDDFRRFNESLKKYLNQKWLK